jgi:hypothetical protein
VDTRRRAQESTLATRYNLAFWTAQAGDAAWAHAQYAALLPVRERVLGAEHPDTLAFRANVAYWTGEAERGGNWLPHVHSRRVRR